MGQKFIQVPGADLPPNPDTKLNQLIDRVYALWEETADKTCIDNETGRPEPIKGATQMVFADLGVGERNGFSACREIKQALVDEARRAAILQWYDVSP